jgi:hypothetical protein
MKPKPRNLCGGILPQVSCRNAAHWLGQNLQPPFPSGQEVVSGKAFGEPGVSRRILNDYRVDTTFRNLNGSTRVEISH